MKSLLPSIPSIQGWRPGLLAIMGIVCGWVLLGACIRKPDFPAAPVINLEGKQFTKATQGGLDSIVLTIGFTDGDGDVGLGPEHNADPRFRKYLSADSSEYNPFFTNLWVRVFVERLDGSYDSIAPTFTLNRRGQRIIDLRNFDARTPVFARPAGIPAVEGSVRLVMRDVFYVNFPGHPGFIPGRRYYLKVNLVDRELRVSNTLLTPPQIVP